jgi:hypothetical protein
VIAISGPEGTFDYVDIGYWAPDCVVEFASGDGSHDSQKFAISDLCRRYTGDDDCLQIKGMTVDLVRRRASPPPVELSVRTTPVNLELRTDETATCRTPCQVQVSPGLHRFQLFEPGRRSSLWQEQVVVRAPTDLVVRYESHRDRQLAASWVLVPAIAGAILFPIGLVKEEPALVWTGAGLTVGGSVGFFLVWESDDVEVTVKPASNQAPR